jgi:tRNA pseudouridine55 synthase
MQKNLNGIFLLDKPLNLSSNHALQRVKRLFKAKKAGHTGSLDPLATGMLPICFGEATKFSQFLLESDKSYDVTATLGIKTTTGDAEGEVISRKEVKDISEETIQNVLQKFIGVIQQIPPMYSAIKFQGKPLYELARKGIEVERKPREVNIYKLTLQECVAHELKMNIHCSKGTYVRTLIEDIGEMLGYGAHVSSLRRTYVNPYENDRMYTLADLEKICEEHGADALETLILPIETSLNAYVSVKLSTSAVFYMRMGQPVMVSQLPKEGFVRMYSQDARFLGVGEVLEDGRVAPRRLVSSL